MFFLTRLPLVQPGTARVVPTAAQAERLGPVVLHAVEVVELERCAGAADLAACTAFGYQQVLQACDLPARRAIRVAGRPARVSLAPSAVGRELGAADLEADTACSE